MKLRKANINGSEGWCVDYGLRDGKRRREYFTDYAKAIGALKQGQKDAAELGRRWAQIEPHERLAVAGILAEIRAAGLTLTEVWQGYKKGVHIVPSAGRVTLRVAIDDLIKSKRAANKRETYIDNLEQYLNAWARGQDHRSLASLTLAELKEFVNGKDAVGSRLTAINRLSTLFSFAIREGWIAANPCQRIERPTLEAKLPEILTNADVKKMLRFTLAELPHMAPWMGLAMFAGLRPEEADQLDWEFIDLDKAKLTIPPHITKIRNARTVNLEPAAVAWLKLGGDLPISRMTRRRAIRKIATHMGWADGWKKDITRHTCASHLIALKQSYGYAALQLGNSEQILRRHYKAGVTDADCKVFWSLTPRGCKKKG